MTVRNRCIALFLLVGSPMVVSIGCGTVGDATRPLVRDSAGIEIVESPAPQWREGEGWVVSPEPILEIGVLEGDDPYLLDGVRGVVRFEDGMVVLANMGDGTIRYFDSTGVHLFSAGGSGGGPAEFRQILNFRRVGDHLIAYQSARDPSKIFDRQGNHVGTISPAPGGFGVGVLGTFADGALLTAAWPQGRTLKGDLFLDSAHFMRTSADRTSTDTVAHLPAWRFVAVEFAIGPPRRNIPQEFGPMPALAVRDASWYFGWPEQYEIRELTADGTVRRILRRRWEPVPVTSDHIEGYRTRMMNLPMEGGGPVPPRLQEQRLAMVDGMLYPEHHPAFERIDVDRAGNIWVERSDPAHPKASAFTRIRDVPTTWDVFDAAGAWLGPVELPARFHVWEIGDGYVAGASKDELDVERVRIYTLAKSS